MQQVFAATADWRDVSSTEAVRARQSAAESRHQVVPARGACNSSTAPGRWCCDRALSSSSSGSAQGPRPPTQTRGHPRSRQYRRSQRRRSVLRLARPHFESTPAIAERPASKLQPNLLMSSCQSTAWQVHAGLGCHGRLACAKAVRACGQSAAESRHQVVPARGACSQSTADSSRPLSAVAPIAR